MSAYHCLKSKEVVEAVRLNEWPAGLQAHIEGCEACRETSRVVSWMAKLAIDAESTLAELPDPKLIWLKAKIGQRSRLPARALLPLKAGSLFGAAGLSLLMMLIPQSAWDWLRQWQTANAGYPRDWQAGGDTFARLQELLPALLTTSLWIPLAAALLFLSIFTASEA